MRSLLVLALLVTGCASPLAPTSQTVRLALTVYDDAGALIPQATATINGQRHAIRRGVADIAIAADAPLTLRIEADGYVPALDTLTFEDRTTGRHLTQTSWTFYLRKYARATR